MLKHVREKHPEARIPIQNGQNGGEKTIEVQEVDVKNDPGRPQPMQIEYKDIHTSASDHQVRVWAFVKMSSQQEFYATVETKKIALPWIHYIWHFTLPYVRRVEVVYY